MVCRRPFSATGTDAERPDIRNVTMKDIPCGQKKRPEGFEGPGSALDSMCEVRSKPGQTQRAKEPKGRPSNVGSSSFLLPRPRTRVMDHRAHRNYSRPMIHYSISSPNTDSSFPTIRQPLFSEFSDTIQGPQHQSQHHPRPVRIIFLIRYRAPYPLLSLSPPNVPRAHLAPEPTTTTNSSSSNNSSNNSSSSSNNNSNSNSNSNQNNGPLRLPRPQPMSNVQDATLSYPRTPQLLQLIPPPP